jgi:hypothetical protein
MIHGRRFGQQTKILTSDSDGFHGGIRPEKEPYICLLNTCDHLAPQYKEQSFFFNENSI